MRLSLLARGEDAPYQTFEEIYERHFTMVYRVCFSYLKNQADAEDAVADVFVKLLRHDTAFKDADHEKAWLLRISINLCKDHLKHWWRKRTDIADYADAEAESPYTENELLATIMSLPERYKDVIYLYYYEGYSTVEIAGILKKPQSTIRNHLREARALLKGVLEDEEQ